MNSRCLLGYSKSRDYLKQEVESMRMQKVHVKCIYEKLGESFLHCNKLTLQFHFSMNFLKYTVIFVLVANLLSVYVIGSL